ncbi:MAG TPA: hypothetical protein VF066_08680 [Thermoleophilaceae bacterium]
MRTGLRICCACLLLSAAMCAPALAADSLSVFTDNSEIALGGVTTLAARAETDASFGGGHVALKYKAADANCAATPTADEGADATAPDQSIRVAAGQGITDVGGQQIQLGVGNWRICGWLIDDANGGAVVAQGTTVVRVLPYSGSLGIEVARRSGTFQITFTYATSGPTRFYATLQRAGRRCPRSPLRLPAGSILLTPRDGRFVASDGGLGRAVPARLLTPGRWRVCSWLSGDVGAVGPASKTFAVPERRRRGARAAG